jgi:hypothetical protein
VQLRRATDIGTVDESTCRRATGLRTPGQSDANGPRDSFDRGNGCTAFAVPSSVLSGLMARTCRVPWGRA